MVINGVVLVNNELEMEYLVAYLDILLHQMSGGIETNVKTITTFGPKAGFEIWTSNIRRRLLSAPGRR
jgi:hypothetical protein